MLERNIGATGGNGFVGSAVFDGDVLRPTSSEVNILDIDQIRAFIKKNKITTLVHAAAHTNVAKAKEEWERVKKINGEGTKNVAMACSEFDVRMVLISSDFIFPGTTRDRGPYSENSRRPESFTSIGLGPYGSSKLLAEYLAEKNCSRLSIVRISYPFGLADPNKDYLLKLTNRVKSGGSIFSDQNLTATYLPDLAVGLNAIIDQDLNGIFHIATSLTTPLDMMKYAVSRLGLSCEIKVGSCTDYLANPKVEPIPQYGGLDCTITQEQIGKKFHAWREAIEEIV